jgi:hypothetical protein
MEANMSTRVWSGILIACSSIALFGCGGGGGGGGATSTEKAAAAGVTAKLAAKFGQIASDQVDDESSTQSLSTKQVESCGQSGTRNETSGSRSSPFLSSNITTERTVANDCRTSESGDGFSSSSREDGIQEFGEAEGGAVSYLRASDIDDDPATGGPFILEASGSGGGQQFNLSARFQGELNICEGCSSPTQGGTQELLGYFSFQISGNQAPNFSASFGDGPDAPIALITTEAGSTTTTSIDGRFGFDDGSDCNFNADYDTISPIITENDTGRTTGGELDVSIDGGESVRVVFNSDGSATINGETFTAEELAALEDDCASVLEDEE